MKVLVISHNVFDYATSMGKTLTKFFENFKSDEVAQLYVHPEEPTAMPFCDNYYRMTDTEAIRSIVTRKDIGEIFTCKTAQVAKPTSISVDINAVYQKGRSRTPLIYITRDCAWKLSKWKNKRLLKWVLDFNPDIIFLASGDYKFIYEIALYIAEYCKKPLITACFDDFYMYNKNKNRFLGPKRQQSFMKIVHKNMRRSSSIITVCEPMAREYKALFSKPTHVMYTPAELENITFNEDAKIVAYFGSLGLGRDDQLIEIGKSFKSLTGRNIDVFSSEKREEVLKKLIDANGISFHRAVTADEMKNILQKCIAVIHTESFDPEIAGRTRFSISTKIAESLAYGPCLFAYGPSDIASIE